jgi:putative ABC transport system ATP-binding protein
MTISVHNLVVEYQTGGECIRPIDGLSFRASTGELTLLRGPSGSGKSTLLASIGGLLTPTNGSIMANSIEVVGLRGAALQDYRRSIVGIAFQSFNLIGSLNAVENIMVPLRSAGVSRRAARQRAVALLNQVGLADRMLHRPHQLSGGEQQRVAIARALAADPPLLLADEPTAHLDATHVQGIGDLLHELASEGRTVVASTHDDRITTFADHIVEMGQVAPRLPKPPQRLLEGPDLLDATGPAPLPLTLHHRAWLSWRM